MIRTCVALSAVACITSLTALVNERQVRPPISSCEAQLSRLTFAPVQMKGSVGGEEFEAMFDGRTE